MVEDNRSRYDAIVIGGGPSGCAYAITLARSGYSVLLLERERFPRFHIGEAFVPYTNDVLDQMGLLDRFADERFVVKHGLEVITPDGVRLVDLGVTAAEGYRDWAYQVERSRFDEILLEAASDEPGVTVIQGAKVTRLCYDGERISGVRYTHIDLDYAPAARLVVDASGRAGVIARGLGRTTGKALQMAAVFKHFSGLDERNNPGRPGDTQIGLHEDGWVWAIPTRGDVISIGTMAPVQVLRESNPEDVFSEHLRRIPRICARITGTKVWRGLNGETNFEYHSDTLAGPGYLIVGDAGSFTDPVFSNGVYLALATGRRAADESALYLAGEISEEEAGERYARFFKTGYETYYRLIRAVYDQSIGYMGTRIQKMLFEAGVGERERVLALNGDMWSDTNPFLIQIRKEKNWALFSEFEPMYGCPVYGRK
jgi:flavin-dependent dehydrogenase